MFSFMDGFSGYNKINILLADQPKIAFICPWGNFSYRKQPFGLKNAGSTFQRAMSYAFHDIKQFVKPTSMIFLLILHAEQIILLIYEPSLYDVGIIRFT